MIYIDLDRCLEVLLILFLRCFVGTLIRVWQGRYALKSMLLVQRTNRCMDSTTVPQLFLPAISRCVFKCQTENEKCIKWPQIVTFWLAFRTEILQVCPIGAAASNACRDSSGHAGQDTVVVSGVTWCISTRCATWAREVGPKGPVKRGSAILFNLPGWRLLPIGKKGKGLDSQAKLYGCK